MSWKFNPFTQELDYFEKSTGTTQEHLFTITSEIIIDNNGHEVMI